MPNGDVAFVGLSCNVVKLGIHYCYNRPSQIFIRDSRSKETKRLLCSSDDGSYAVRSLLYCRGRLYFLRSCIGGSHFGAAELCSVDPSDAMTLRVHLTDVFAERIDARENCIYFTEPHRSVRTYRVFDIVTEALVGTGEEESTISRSLLDLHSEFLLVKESTLTQPQSVHLRRISNGYEVVGEERVELGDLYSQHSLRLDFLETSQLQVCRLSDHADFLLARPRTPNGSLILTSHGGPNSVFTTEFRTDVALFLSMGFTLVAVNYTGSIGYGQEGIRLLQGHIGEVDIQDVLLALATVKGMCGPFAKVIPYGGSHGGYISALLTGLHPKEFAACILVNPVLDLPSMSYASDIIDWTFGQLDVPFDLRHPRPANEEEVRKFHQHSPSRYLGNVCTPTLILLGERDLRVPPFHGRIWHTWLKAKGVPTTLFTFPDAGHALDTPRAEKNMLLAVRDYLQSLLDQH